MKVASVENDRYPCRGDHECDWVKHPGERCQRKVKSTQATIEMPCRKICNFSSALRLVLGRRIYIRTTWNSTYKDGAICIEPIRPNKFKECEYEN